MVRAVTELRFERVSESEEGRVYRMAWYAVGPKGAVQLVTLVLYDSRLANLGMSINLDGATLLPSDVGYHSPVPMYEGQEPIDNDCEWAGGTCYYDGSSLRAERPIRAWVASKGDDSVIERFLAQEYEAVFGE